MKHSNIVKELASMLYWTMLAACTVGPGTVVTCARAGAEFNLTLTWALLFASALAYTLQEGTARRKEIMKYLLAHKLLRLGICSPICYPSVLHGRII